MLLSLIELAGNKALDYDSATQTRLQKLQGKTMTLHIKTLDQSLSLMPRAEGLEFSSQPPKHVDVTLSTTLGAMIKISRDGLEDAELQAGELEMSGDPIIGQRFAQVIAGLDIDWQSLLAEQIGEAPARTVTTVAGHAKELAQESRERMHHLVERTIKEDMNIVADKQAVNKFLDDVDNLRADVDRLAARLARLAKKLD